MNERIIHFDIGENPGSTLRKSKGEKGWERSPFRVKRELTLGRKGATGWRMKVIPPCVYVTLAIPHR